MRKEQDIFDELARLCVSPGYAHAIAYLCYRENCVTYSEGEGLTPDAMNRDHSITRAEISTLIGLLVKDDIDWTLPAPPVMQQYLDETEALLQELHESMLQPVIAAASEESEQETPAGSGFNPLGSGKVLRETIFYGDESAYTFQFRDLAPRKYENDEAWLETNKGFSINTAREIGYVVAKIQNEKLSHTLAGMQKTSPDTWSILPAFTFTDREVAERADIDVAIAQRVFAAFSVPPAENNRSFQTLNDFNIVNAAPLIRYSDDSFVLFQNHSLVEAMYESPFYWMCEDRQYRATAMQNRGRFTEEFCQERLELVFGKKNVHSNVDIVKSKGEKIGEIDVLVLFGNRAIVLQAKSKKLTLEARKGNDRKIRDDFTRSVQNAYDQGYKCAEFLARGEFELKGTDTQKITVRHKLKEIYVICVVSSYYPALSSQARQFLKSQSTDIIPPPFIMEVFTLDAMTEMLQSPLTLLSYINRRTNYSDRLHANHELTILSHHIKTNLWVDDEHDLVFLGDDISTDLDAAMTVRREGFPGKRTPDGILTCLGRTTLGRIVKAIEASPSPATIDLGFMLMTFSEETFVHVSDKIDEIVGLARRDGKDHDLTMPFREGKTGLIIHCNNDPVVVADRRLRAYCIQRKYIAKADTWFGICISPETATLRFSVSLDHKWERSAEMDAKTRDFLDLVASISRSPQGATRKIGRNTPCPCGSGLKYKKCCLSR